MASASAKSKAGMTGYSAPSGRKKNKLMDLWSDENASRQDVLEVAQFCAALTKPWAMPKENNGYRKARRQGHSRALLPENFQSLGSRGMNNLEGRSLMGIFSPGTPWLIQYPSALVRTDPRITNEAVNGFAELLFRHDIIIQSAIENVTPGYRDPMGFRSSMRSAISQILITGDTMIQIIPTVEGKQVSYRYKVIPRDRYTTVRDCCGDVVTHSICEGIDPLTMTDEQLEKAGLKYADLEDKPYCDREMDIVTRIEFQPRGKNWTVKQEVNGEIVNESQEAVSPFLCVPFDLILGEDYGHSFVEHNKGNLYALDKIWQNTLDFAAAASKIHPCIRAGSETTPDDLAQPSGTPIEGCDVDGGVVRDVAFLQVNKLNDFNVVHLTRQGLENQLGAAMLLTSESVRQSERTTAFEVAEVTIKENEGALGSFYAPMADRLQRPLVHYVRHDLRSRNILPTLPPELIEIETLTGIAALTRIAKSNRILNLVDVASKLGPQVMMALDGRAILDVFMRYNGIDERITKSPEQVQQEIQQALAVQAQQQANQKGIDVAGNVAENALTQRAA